MADLQLAVRAALPTFQSLVPVTTRPFEDVTVTVEQRALMRGLLRQVSPEFVTLEEGLARTYSTFGLYYRAGARLVVLIGGLGGVACFAERIRELAPEVVGTLPAVQLFPELYRNNRLSREQFRSLADRLEQEYLVVTERYLTLLDLSVDPWALPVPLEDEPATIMVGGRRRPVVEVVRELRQGGGNEIVRGRLAGELLLV